MAGAVKQSRCTEFLEYPIPKLTFCWEESFGRILKHQQSPAPTRRHQRELRKQEYECGETMKRYRRLPDSFRKVTGTGGTKGHTAIVANRGAVDGMGGSASARAEPPSADVGKPEEGREKLEGVIQGA